MGAEAAARVRQEFTWDQVARSTLDVYEGVLRPATPLPLDGPRWAVTA